MKRLLFLLIATAAIVSSCSKENIKDEDGGTNAPEGISYVGEVKVTQDDGSVFTKPDIEVIIQPDADKAQMRMLKVSFAPTMPIELDMTVDGISYARTGDGYTLSGNGIVPVAMGGEFPAYTITDLSGADSNGTLAFSMQCGKYPLRYSGVRK